MNTCDIVILIINILIAIASGIGAYNSIRYFKKSRHITIYAQTNKALGEIDEMLKRLPEALSAASTNKKGFSAEITIREIGTEMANHLNAIMSSIPSSYSGDFRVIQKTESFDLSQYINSLIDGTAIKEDNDRKTLGRDSFDACQECLREMQEFLKKKIADEEEKLK